MVGKSRIDGPENKTIRPRLSLNGFNWVRRGMQLTFIDEEKAVPKRKAVCRNLDQFCAREQFATERVLPKSEVDTTTSDESGA